MKMMQYLNIVLNILLLCPKTLKGKKKKKLSTLKVNTTFLCYCFAVMVFFPIKQTKETIHNDWKK